MNVIKTVLKFQIEPFHAHVFLDHHLEPWCPKKGPVRHFMELVCVGLSKNPYITVEKKIDHIKWYKNYFEDPEHEEILRISGAIEYNIVETDIRPLLISI